MRFAAFVVVAVVSGGFCLLRAQRYVASVDTVPVYVTAQDRDGRLVPDLRREDFRIKDNGKPVDITTFENRLVPITAVLLLDTSLSMVKSYAAVRDSAKHFVQALLPEDRLRIGTFATEVALSPILTNDKPTLLRILDEELWPGGQTALWRAASQGIASLAGAGGRRVVVFLTDGTDLGFHVDCEGGAGGSDQPDGPCVGAGDVLATAENEGIMFYAIGYAGHGLDPTMRSIADRTGGGRFEIPRDADLEATFDRVVDELHHQYTLGFTPAVIDGKTHTIDVQVDRPGVKTRARKSYVAKAGR